MEVFLVAFEFARAYAHKGYPVTVSLIHICLNLEHESGEFLVKGIDYFIACNARQRRHGHFKEAFQKRLDAEVIQSGAEEHGAELTAAHLLDIELVACAVKKLDIVGKCLAKAPAYKLV